MNMNLKLTKQEVRQAYNKINHEYNKEVKMILSKSEYTRYKLLRAFKGLWAEKHGYYTLTQHIPSHFIKTNLLHTTDNNRTVDIDLQIVFPWDINIDAKAGFSYSKSWNRNLFDYFYICEVIIPPQYTIEISGYNILNDDYDALYDSKEIVFNPHGFYKFEDAYKDGYIKKYKMISVEDFVKQVWLGK